MIYGELAISTNRLFILHNFINWQHPALILKVWPLIIGVVFFYRTYISCYINSGEEGTDSVAGKMVQDIKWKIKG